MARIRLKIKSGKIIDHRQRVGFRKYGGAEYHNHHGSSGKEQIESLRLFVVQLVLIQGCSFLSWLMDANRGLPS